MALRIRNCPQRSFNKQTWITLPQTLHIQSSFQKAAALNMQIIPAESEKLSQNAKGHTVLIRPTPSGLQSAKASIKGL